MRRRAAMGGGCERVPQECERTCVGRSSQTMSGVKGAMKTVQAMSAPSQPYFSVILNPQERKRCYLSHRPAHPLAKPHTPNLYPGKQQRRTTFGWIYHNIPNWAHNQQTWTKGQQEVAYQNRVKLQLTHPQSATCAPPGSGVAARAAAAAGHQTGARSWTGHERTRAAAMWVLKQVRRGLRKKLKRGSAFLCGRNQVTRRE